MLSNLFQNQLFKEKKRNNIGVLTSLDSDQARCFVGPMWGLFWSHAVFKGYQQTALVEKEFKMSSMPMWYAALSLGLA